MTRCTKNLGESSTQALFFNDLLEASHWAIPVTSLSPWKTAFLSIWSRSAL